MIVDLNKSISIKRILSYKRNDKRSVFMLAPRKRSLRAFLSFRKEISICFLLFRYLKWQCNINLVDKIKRISTELYLWRKLCDFSQKKKEKKT